VDVIGRIAAIVLGIVFVVAGATKVAAGPTWIAQARQMGATQVVATAVPGVELVIGALLVTGIAMPAPAIAAIVLLVVFTVVIARQLMEGRHPACACFGTWSTRPLGEVHLLRNVAFIALAVVACFS
jgi:uncharacterized membrane protein YphA (DoxX/SURF4 family)